MPNVLVCLASPVSTTAPTSTFPALQNAALAKLTLLCLITRGDKTAATQATSFIRVVYATWKQVRQLEDVGRSSRGLLVFPHSLDYTFCLSAPRRSVSRLLFPQLSHQSPHWREGARAHSAHSVSEKIPAGHCREYSGFCKSR